jgi:hypothetical protein
MNQLADGLQLLDPAAAASMRGRALRLGLSTDALTKKVAKTILESVVRTTPHDTGQARANWQIEISASQPVAAPLLGVTDYDGESTIVQGQAEIEATKRQPGQTIWITNALDYIESLNNGHSKQAAAGFVARAVQAGLRIVRNAKLGIE